MRCARAVCVPGITWLRGPGPENWPWELALKTALQEKKEKKDKAEKGDKSKDKGDKKGESARATRCCTYLK